MKAVEEDRKMPEELKIGDYTDLDADAKAVKLSFSLQALEVVTIWSRCGLIANFASSYMAVANQSKKNIANSLSFILNELIENADKYTDPKESVLHFALSQQEKNIIISVTNPISKGQVGPLQEMARNLIDPEYVNTRYIDILMASGKSSEKSGIGLLTIINYYQAALSFRIGTSPGGSVDRYSIEAKLNVEEL